MQPQPQQIPQPQMMPLSSQIPNPNIYPYPQNQIYQIVQAESPNKCEKCSRFLTGSTNIPLGVFIILMSSYFFHLCCIFYNFGFLSTYYITASLIDFLFAIFVWSKMAIKIEKTTSTVKYFSLYLLNLIILSFITFTFPLARIWNFILFETILIALINKNRKMEFFCCKISGKYMIIFTIIYHLIFNPLNIVSIIVTIIYAFIYKKWLIYKLNISNEKVQRIEYDCIVNFLKNKLKTFITLDDVLNQGKNNQPQVQQVQNINNSINNSNASFVPYNMYPNYYSEVAQNNQNQVPVQQYPPNAQPVVNMSQNS